MATVQPFLSPRVRQLEASRIREVANAGLGRPDVLAFWFGESDSPTPAAIGEAASASLAQGETFYSHNLGLPSLREAIADYTTQLHQPLGAAPVTADRVAVTSGGVNGLMLAVQALVEPGDEVLAVTPVWPNLTAQPRIMGAHLRTFALQVESGAWQLDVESLCAAITPQTRLLILNAPNNPTGWTLTRAAQAAILARCRATGTWILADEVYERLYYDPLPCAPSFLDVADAQDRLVVVQSFSKSFLMTGWRLGWLVMPAELTEVMGKLIEFNTSCAPVFVQRAGLAALAEAQTLVPAVVQHLRHCRDTLVPLLREIPGVETQAAAGGMYAFLRVAGHDDGVAMAKRLVAEAGLGLAPGEAFAPEAAGWLRWCFASRDPARLVEGVARLRGWLQR